MTKSITIGDCAFRPHQTIVKRCFGGFGVFASTPAGDIPIEAFPIRQAAESLASAIARADPGHQYQVVGTNIHKVAPPPKSRRCIHDNAH